MNNISSSSMRVGEIVREGGAWRVCVYGAREGGWGGVPQGQTALLTAGCRQDAAELSKFRFQKCDRPTSLPLAYLAPAQPQVPSPSKSRPWFQIQIPAAIGHGSRPLVILCYEPRAAR